MSKSFSNLQNFDVKQCYCCTKNLANALPVLVYKKFVCLQKESVRLLPSCCGMTSETLTPTPTC